MANDVITIEIRASGDDAAAKLDQLNAALKETAGTSKNASEGFSDFQAAIVTAREGIALAVEAYRKLNDLIIESTLKWAEQVNELSHVAEALGISVQQMDLLNQASYLLTGQADALGSMMLRLERNLGMAAQTGSGPAAQAIEDLGIALSDVLALPADEQFQIIVERLGQLTDPTQRSRDAMVLFGRSWQDLIPLMADGGKGLQEAMARADEYGRHLTPGAIQASKDLTEATRELGLAWDNLVTRSAPVIRAITEIVRGLRDMVDAAKAYASGQPLGGGGGGGGPGGTTSPSDDMALVMGAVKDSARNLRAKFDAAAEATQAFRDAEAKALSGGLFAEGWLETQSAKIADLLDATSKVSVEWDQFASNNTQSIADMLEAQDSYTKTMDNVASTADRLILHGLMPSVSTAISAWDQMNKLFDKDFGEGGEFSKLMNMLGTKLGGLLGVGDISGGAMSGGIGALLALIMQNPEMQAAMKKLNDLLQALITPLVKGIEPALDAMAPIMEDLQPVFEDIGAALKEYLKPLVEEMKLVHGALGEVKNAIESVKGPIEHVGEVLKGPLETLWNNINSVVGPGSGLFRVFQALGHAVDQLDALLNPVIQGLFAAVAVIGPMLDPIKVIRDALSTVSHWMHELVNSLSPLIDAIKRLIKALGGNWFDSGGIVADNGPTISNSIGLPVDSGHRLVVAAIGERFIMPGQAGYGEVGQRAGVGSGINIGPIYAMNPTDVKNQMRALLEELIMTRKLGLA